MFKELLSETRKVNEDSIGTYKDQITSHEMEGEEIVGSSVQDIPQAITILKGISALSPDVQNVISYLEALDAEERAEGETTEIEGIAPVCGECEPDPVVDAEETDTETPSQELPTLDNETEEEVGKDEEEMEEEELESEGEEEIDKKLNKKDQKMGESKVNELKDTLILQTRYKDLTKKGNTEGLTAGEFSELKGIMSDFKRDGVELEESESAEVKKDEKEDKEEMASTEKEVHKERTMDAKDQKMGEAQDYKKPVSKDLLKSEVKDAQGEVSKEKSVFNKNKSTIAKNPSKHLAAAKDTVNKTIVKGDYKSSIH